MRVEKQTAGKDYPEHDIAKGDVYYSWTPFRQKRRISKTYPKPYDLEQTVYADVLRADEALAEARAACENAEDAETFANAIGGVRDAVSDLDNVIDEYNAFADAWDDKTEAAQNKRNAADEIDSFKDEVESACDDAESAMEDYTRATEEREQRAERRAAYAAKTDNGEETTEEEGTQEESDAADDENEADETTTWESIRDDFLGALPESVPDKP